MTRFKFANDLKGEEARQLIEILRRRASTFLDWGYDEKCFWIELDPDARNPWPNLLREVSIGRLLPSEP